MSERLALLAVCLLATAPAAATGPAELLRANADADTVELTTTGRSSGRSRTVTIWFVVDAQGRLYVQSGRDGRTDWYRNLRKTPAATVRIGALALRGTAAPVDDPAEVARVHALFAEKYLRARITGWFGGEAGHGKVVELRDPTPLP